MKIGLIPANVGVPNAQAMIGMAQLAESLGFESIWTFEHAIIPIDYESKYPYDKSGKMGAAPETPFVDPLICLSAIAAATSKVRPFGGEGRYCASTWAESAAAMARSKSWRK